MSTKISTAYQFFGLVHLCKRIQILASAIGLLSYRYLFQLSLRLAHGYFLSSLWALCWYLLPSDLLFRIPKKSSILKNVLSCFYCWKDLNGFILSKGKFLGTIMFFIFNGLFIDYWRFIVLLVFSDKQIIFYVYFFGRCPLFCFKMNR